MCEKQCRDENGFKCHCESESHQRAMQLFADAPGKFLSEFSREFETGFMDLLKRRFERFELCWGFVCVGYCFWIKLKWDLFSFCLILNGNRYRQRVKANTVYTEYISDKQHIHMNATSWVTLSGFCKVNIFFSLFTKLNFQNKLNSITFHSNSTWAPLGRRSRRRLTRVGT